MFFCVDRFANIELYEGTEDDLDQLVSNQMLLDEAITSHSFICFVKMCSDCHMILIGRILVEICHEVFSRARKQ